MADRIEPVVYICPSKSHAYCCHCEEVKACTVRRELVGDGSYWDVWICDTCGVQADQEYIDPT